MLVLHLEFNVIGHYSPGIVFMGCRNAVTRFSYSSNGGIILHRIPALLAFQVGLLPKGRTGQGLN